MIDAPDDEKPMISSVEEELTFQRVLQIAQSKEVDAKAQLERLRDEGPDEAQLSMLARRLLGHWNDTDNTYYSKARQPIESTCINKDQLKAMYPGSVDATRLYVELRVRNRRRPRR